jgi:hypothetical protein
VDFGSFTARADAFRLISARKQNDMSVKTTGTVKFALDPKRPPALTKKAKIRLARLADKDIEATHGVDWKRVGRTAIRLA